MSELIQVTMVRLYALAALASIVMLVSSFSHAREVQVVSFESIEAVLDLYQGEAKCVDILEAKLGENALIVDGRNIYSIENACDFE